MMTAAKNKKKLALLTNMIAPYRLPIYSILGDQFNLLLLHGGKEANRDSWGNVEGDLSNVEVVRAWGWQIRRKKRFNGKVFDEQFVHVTPGFLWHLLRFRPDAIISSEMGFRSLVALAYGTVFRKPVWLWWEGTLHSERNIDSFRKVLRRCFSFSCRHWITCGQTSTEYLLSLGVQRDGILQSQNSVDEERFKTPVEPAWEINPKPVVLHVGQFIGRKGIGALLDAAALVQQKGHEFSLLLVGEGPEKAALEQRAKSLGLRNVHFCAAQTPESMPSVYRSADLVVFPTLQDVWGFVANEAILCGIPVLCSRYAGCASELFAPESIFSPDDLDDFSEKLGAAVSGELTKADPSRLKTKLEVGRELIQEVNKFLPSTLTTRQNEAEPLIR